MCVAASASTPARDDVAGALLAVPWHGLRNDAIDHLSGQRLGDSPCGSTGKRASPDDTACTHDAGEDEQAEDSHDTAGTDGALFEPRNDDLVDDETNHHRREHGARGEHGGESDSGEEEALVVTKESADQPCCLGQATGVGRNNRAGPSFGTFNWHVVGPTHV